jgi:NodT family efflux transporter outer membrane factor (OMF) lipoprotein
MRMISALPILLLTSAGCASLLPPDSARAAPFDASALPITAPAQFVSAPPGPFAGPVADTKWAARLGDPALTGLIDEALANNLDIRSAQQQLEAARATARAAAGSRLPSLNGSARAGWSSFAVDTPAGRTRTESPDYDLGLSASWEPDFWGRVGGDIAIAEAQAQASAADLAAVRLLVAGETAQAWVALKAAQRQLDLAQSEVEIRTRSLRLTEQRLSRGLTNALDVRLARSALASAEAGLEGRRRSLGDAARRLEIVLGRYPAGQMEAGVWTIALSELPGAGDPASLLARRPDVAAAEARLFASGVQAEQARRALKPRLNLTASLSLADSELSDLFDLGDLAGQVLSSLTVPIFNGGALTAQAEAALARAEIAFISYAGTTLDAYNEVEQTAAADRALLEQERLFQVALDEARKAEDLAERQYRSGLASIFNLLDAQARRLNAEGTLIDIQAARAANRIRYHIALGGDQIDGTAPALTVAQNSQGAE